MNFQLLVGSPEESPAHLDVERATRADLGCGEDELPEGLRAGARRAQKGSGGQGADSCGECQGRDRSAGLGELLGILVAGQRVEQREDN